MTSSSDPWSPLGTLCFASVLASPAAGPAVALFGSPCRPPWAEPWAAACEGLPCSVRVLWAAFADVGVCLEKNELDRFGELLHQHWITKKKRSDRMSNHQIDRWYEIGRAAGALGGKILGAGGGGFLMFYCPAEYRWQLREAMSREGLREMHFNFDLAGVKVLTNI